VKGDNGVLRDIYDRPMVVVFNATKGYPDDKNSSGRTSRASPSPKNSPFAFVHVDGSTKEDRKARALIRTHVMQDHFRRKRQKATQERHAFHSSAKSIKVPVEASVAWAVDLFGTCSLPLQPTGNLDPFSRYPIEMTPRTHQLVNHCKCPDCLIFFFQKAHSIWQMSPSFQGWQSRGPSIICLVLRQA